MKIDIVIPFIEGPDDSFELKYMLRSLEQNLQAEPVIWLLGDKPQWLINVNHILFEPARGDFKKFRDQLTKLEWMINQKDLGKEFIYMYDDQFFLNPVTVEEIKKPRSLENMADHKIWFQQADAGRNWITIMKQTLLRLQKERLPLFNCETHLPRVFSKSQCKKLFEKYNIPENLYQFSTLYYNNYCNEPPEILSRYNFFKLAHYQSLSANAIIRKAKRYKIMNILPRVYDEKTKTALKRLFPNPSKYEYYVQKSQKPRRIQKNKRDTRPIEQPKQEDKAKKLRDEYPFLGEPSCPEELKVLVAEMITAFYTYKAAHKKLFDCNSNEEQLKTAREVVENYRENRMIHRELDYYKKHGKILGLHPKFKHLAEFRKLRTMNILELYKKKEKLEHNIWRIKDEIKKGNKPHLYVSRNERIRQKETELAEINRLLHG